MSVLELKTRGEYTTSLGTGFVRAGCRVFLGIFGLFCLKTTLIGSFHIPWASIRVLGITLEKFYLLI